MNKVIKKILLIFVIVISVLIVSVSIFLYIKSLIKHDVLITLNGLENITLNYQDEYVEDGAYVYVDNINKTDELIIDKSKMDLSKIGTYFIKYFIIVNKKEYSKYRQINIIDQIEPVITLNGSDTVTILLNEKYEEAGATGIDNYDGDISDRITISGNVDTSVPGEYKLIYELIDTSNNKTTKERIVTVKKPNVVTKENKEENKEVIKKVVTSKQPNSVTENNFTNNGFIISGYKNNNNGEFIIKLIGNNTYSYNADNVNGNYSVNIDLTDVENGEYNLIIESNAEEKILNKMSYITRLNRAKVKDKLVTFTYLENDAVKITISPFNYQYDILIDPGHGGTDAGAVNQYVYEKDMNLKVSLYEKCRYLSHGLKVYMTRETDTYGSGYGSIELSRLHRRAYEVGYYGVVSKIVYSNHHNYSYSKNIMGYELLIPAKVTDLDTELNIVSRFNSLYNLEESHKRFYAKNYDNENMYSKLNKEEYNFKDNYAINRIPYQAFNVKAIIYEGSYMSNEKEFNWYWKNSNWIKVSEIKIEEYIKSLGLSYNSDNSSCL